MKLFAGIIFILIGVSLLFGFLNSEIWGNVFENFLMVWPVIFVFIGLSVLTNIPSLRWIKYLNGVLTVLFILFLFFWKWDIGWQRPLNTYTLPTIAIEESIPGAGNGIGQNIRLLFRGASVDVEFYASTEGAVSITGTYQSYTQNLIVKQIANEITIEFPQEYTQPFRKNFRKKLIVFLPASKRYDVLMEGGSVRWYSAFEQNPFQKVEIRAAIAYFTADLASVPAYRADSVSVPMYLTIKAAIANLALVLSPDLPYYADIRSVINNQNLQAHRVNRPEEASIRVSVESAICTSSVRVKEGK